MITNRGGRGKRCGDIFDIFPRVFVFRGNSDDRRRCNNDCARGKDALSGAAAGLLPPAKFCRSRKSDNICFDSFYYCNSRCGFATGDGFPFDDFGIVGFASNYPDFANCGSDSIERSR